MLATRVEALLLRLRPRVATADSGHNRVSLRFAGDHEDCGEGQRLVGTNGDLRREQCDEAITAEALR